MIEVIAFEQVVALATLAGALLACVGLAVLGLFYGRQR